MVAAEMLEPVAALFLATSLAARPAIARAAARRRARRSLLLVATAGSVAFWLWQRQRQRRPSSIPSGAVLREPERELARCRAAARAAVPAGAPSAAAPWPRRVTSAVHEARAAELRRVAAKLLAADRELEAGLLSNYALLLERSPASHARVVTEAERMLRAAAAFRGEPEAPALRVAPEPPAAALPGTFRVAGPGRSPARTPLVPMPMPGKQRRAAR